MKGDLAGPDSARIDKLSGSAPREIRAVLSDPSVVLRELQQQATAQFDPHEVARLKREVVSSLEREKRLVRLYTYGEIDDGVVRDEGIRLKRERLLLEARLLELRRPSGGLTPWIPTG